MGKVKVSKQRRPKYLPKTLSVMDEEYSITPRSKSWMAKHEAFGMCSYDSKLLEVGITDDKVENLATLAHEFAHAYIHENNIKVYKRWKEETLVKLMEKIFIDLYNQLNKG